MSALPTIQQLIPELRNHRIDLPAMAARVGAFGDSTEQSRELLDLVRCGRKRGGASLLWAHEFEGEPIPKPGEIEVGVDHLSRPCVITRVTEVEIVAFNGVSASFAAREGEGDGSLECWRRAHWDFFSRECRRIDREPSETMPVVCCSFEVVSIVPGAG